MDRRLPAARFPDLAPPEPPRARARAVARPLHAALPVVEWAVFGGLLMALLLMR